MAAGARGGGRHPRASRPRSRSRRPVPARRRGRPRGSRPDRRAAPRRRGRDSSAGSPSRPPRRPVTRSRVMARASGSMPAVGSSRTQDLRTADEGDRQAKPLPLPARTAGGTASSRRRPARPARASPSGSRGSAWNRAYWRIVSAGRARMSKPPAWSIRPTRARSARPPVRGSSPEHPDRAGVRGAIALDDLDGRGLARAVGPQQRDELARRTARETPSSTARAPVALDEPVDRDRRPARGARPAGRGAHGAILAYCRSKSASPDLPDLDGAQDPVAVDEVRLRPARDPVRGLERLVGVLHRGPRGAVVGDEPAGGLGRIVGQDADDGQAVRRVLRLLGDRAAGTPRGRARTTDPRS